MLYTYSVRTTLLIIFILFFGVGGYLYYKNSTSTAPPITVRLNSIFPLGKERADITEEVTTEDGFLTDTPGIVVGEGSTSEEGQVISSVPVAGFTVRTKIEPNTPPVDVIRYVRRENGFVYEKVGTDATLQVSNVRIPDIYEAIFAEGGMSVLLRFLKNDQRTIATYYIPIPEETAAGTRVQLPGTYLQDNILSLAVFANGKKIATLKDEKGESVVRISEPKGDKAQVFFTYPFKDWLLLSSTGDIYLQTKAHSSVPGTLFQLTRGGYKKIISSTAGLTSIISPSGTYAVGSQTSGESFSAFIINTKTNQQKNISLPLLPEKCTWDEIEHLICAVPEEALGGGYPERWYQGTVHFTDRLVRINTQTGITSTIPINQSFDMTQLEYSKGTKTLYFIEKRSGSLIKLPL